MLLLVIYPVGDRCVGANGVLTGQGRNGKLIAAKAGDGLQS